MAESTSDAFLNGQGIPVDPGQIESELSRLWGPAAERAGGPELENPNVTRIVLANLIVEAGPDCPGCLEATLDTVIGRYPCRSIVLKKTSAPGRTLSAEVAALCQLPTADRPQVCSERIVLRAGPEAIDLLPGATRPLLEANLPSVLWWTEDPRRDEKLFRDLAGECSRLILDLPDPEADPAALRLGLDPSINRFARDAAWFGITRWRELVAQFFDGPNPTEALSRIASVEIRAEVPGSPGIPRSAAWLVGWLAGQLDWAPIRREEKEPGRVQATFRGPSGEIPVSIRTEGSSASGLAQILDVNLTARGPDGDDSLHLNRCSPTSPQVRVIVSSPSACALPRIVNAPEPDAPGRVAAALESSRHDLPFGRALGPTLWLLGISES
ncbi:glucose-6-phosphate dehydrogenase assembly protein OpcA [Tundrisphaera lichenicola]|uniref:glucose-6-phosphate dehydrogenase assembly protein OpcA n=1 Tax=Tundrisphaera lichenicola TaxID=2029860 RepID=UPI003EB88BE5